MSRRATPAELSEWSRAIEAETKHQEVRHAASSGFGVFALRPLVMLLDEVTARRGSETKKAVPVERPKRLPFPTFTRALEEMGVLEIIEAEVARHHEGGVGLTLRDLYESDTHARIATVPRDAAWWMMARGVPGREGIPYIEIGRVWGRDHTTILQGVRRHAARTGKPFLLPLHERRKNLKERILEDYGPSRKKET